MTGEPSVTIFVESEDADSSTFVGPLELFELFEVELMALTPLRRGVIFPRVASSVPRRRPSSSLDPCLSSGSLVMRSYAALAARSRQVVGRVVGRGEDVVAVARLGLEALARVGQVG